MKKNHYLKEIVIAGTQKRKGDNNKRKEVRKIQSWLCLQERNKPGLGVMTSIDGDFGPATEKSVKNFQKSIGEKQDGIVTQKLFSILTLPLKKAFEGTVKQANVRLTILEAARNNLNEKPFELIIDDQANSGPWVRSYMDGKDGQWWFWCMGFVQAVIDQAFSLHGKNFKDMMPLTYSCDTVGNKGFEKKVLIRNSKIRQNPALVRPGDIMLLRKSRFDWTHTAVIVDVNGSTFTTIEGNTNANGSRNGDGVYMRVRNFKKSMLDVFSIERWVASNNNLN